MGKLNLKVKKECIICKNVFLTGRSYKLTCSEKCSRKNSRAKSRSKIIERSGYIKAVNLPNEIWKEINQSNGMYFISDLGRVKRIRYGKEEILANSIVGVGYLIVRIMLDTKLTRRYLHRLVAEHFINKVDDRNVVNHIDGNKLNNCVENLEFTYTRENVSHGKIKTKKSSKYTGVTYCKANKNYRSSITIDRNYISLGCFKNEIDAHNAYQKALEDNNLKNKYSIS